MRYRILYIFLVTVLFCSCRTQFEKVRSSNDPEKILVAANKYFEDGEYYNSTTLYEIIIPFYRGKQQAEEIFYNYSYAHYHMNQFILASHYFNKFGTTFYNSEKREETEFMSAYSKYRLSPNYKLDQSYSVEAIDDFQRFINRHPNSERVAESNELIDEMREKLELKAFSQGKLYYNTGQHVSSVKVFENMLKDFPETERAEEVRILVLKASQQLAEKSIYEKKQERLEDVLEYTDKFLKRYPKSSFRKEAKSLRKNTLTELEKFKV